MTKWIRWSGLAGFLIIVGLIAALVVLALPMAIRFTIEFVGSKVAGAEVSVADVDVGLSPLGVTLRDVQVADARQPMQNLVQFDTATADLELAPLLVGKAISQQLVVDNLQFHTERTTSGALPVSDEVEESNEPGIKEKTLEALPSVDEVLARETLKTPAAGKALSESWEAQSQAVETAMAEVPDQAALSRYRTEIEEITSGRLESIEDFRQRKARLDALKAQFKKDKQAVEAARAAVTTGKQEVSDRLAELKRAPGEDLTYLKDKYQLSGTGVSNLTGLLFGDDAANWAREALYWYERIQPYLSDDGSEDDSPEVKEEKQARLAGEFVHFPTDNPWPDFLIREARLSGPFDGGSLVIRGQDITHQQKVTGRATVFTATGEQLQKIGDLDARLTLDHTGQRGRDSLNLAVSDWAMAPVALGVAGAELSQAKVQLTSQAVVEGGVLAADLQAKVRQATFDGDGQTLFARELNSA
ncbi:MAG: TIGR03545 family protein, partial [Pseudomonadota bacterium]|nr:TIGR03545 family protein [Pseudomonadota bacterium]